MLWNGPNVDVVRCGMRESVGRDRARYGRCCARCDVSGGV